MTHSVHVHCVHVHCPVSTTNYITLPPFRSHSSTSRNMSLTVPGTLSGSDHHLSTLLSGCLWCGDQVSSHHPITARDQDHGWRRGCWLLPRLAARPALSTVYIYRWPRRARPSPPARTVHYGHSSHAGQQGDWAAVSYLVYMSTIYCMLWSGRRRTDGDTQTGHWTPTNILTVDCPMSVPSIISVQETMEPIIINPASNRG